MNKEPVSVQVLEVAPRPGLLVKHRRTGEFGHIKYFKWKGGEASTIPVVMDNGTEDHPSYFAFSRRYEIVDPSDKDYVKKQELKDIDDQLATHEKELNNITVTRHNSVAGVKELPPLLKVAMQARIRELEKEERSLNRTINRLKDRKTELEK